MNKHNLYLNHRIGRLAPSRGSCKSVAKAVRCPKRPMAANSFV